MPRPTGARRENGLGNGEGSLWRGPLMLLLGWGVVTSSFASGTLNVRLIVDGMVSFAFVPVVQIVALACVKRRRQSPPVPFARLVNLFFAGFRPWLLWMAVQAAIFTVVPPRQTSWWLGALNWSALIPAALSLRIDVRFFEVAVGRPRRGAVVDAVAQRAIAWTVAILYFYGVGIYSVVLSWLAVQGWL